MKIHSRDEWSPLRSIIVGDATGARLPRHDAMFDHNHETTSWKQSPVPQGAFPDHVIDEANQDLETLCATLRQLGVEVHRPLPQQFETMVSTKDWSTDGMYNYCPRDVLLVIDDLVIECPMSYRSRQDEAIAYDHVRRAAMASGARWISAPRPRLLSGENRVENGRVILNECEPIFDAANVCRLGQDLLYLVSATANIAGARWLQNVLGDQYRVHLLENVYSAAHIDSTVTALREGVVVLNASRIQDHNCPAVFSSWTKIYVEDVVPQGFYQYPYASKWIALNMLSVDPDTVIVDAQQTELISTLEQHRFTVIPLTLRHSRTLGGGFHCVTLDLERDRS